MANREFPVPDFFVKTLNVTGTIASATMSGNLTFSDSLFLVFGSSGDARLNYNTTQTVDTLFLGLSSDSNHMVVAQLGDVGYDFAHAQETNPTLFIQSATQSATEWISITHDQTDGVIDCGTGTLNLGATGNVNFAGAAKTGTGDAVLDGYVTMEVAGAAVKFATTA